MIECTPGSDNGLNQSFFVQLFPSSAFSDLISSYHQQQQQYHDTSGQPFLFSLSPTHQVKEQEKSNTNQGNGRGSSINDGTINNGGSNIVRNSISSMIPRFLVDNLTPGSSYTAIIYSWNVKGRSAGHVLKSIKLGTRPSEKRSNSVHSGSIISSFDVSADQTGSNDGDNLFER